MSTGRCSYLTHFHLLCAAVISSLGFNMNWYFAGSFPSIWSLSSSSLSSDTLLPASSESESSELLPEPESSDEDPLLEDSSLSLICLSSVFFFGFASLSLSESESESDEESLPLSLPESSSSSSSSLLSCFTAFLATFFFSSFFGSSSFGGFSLYFTSCSLYLHSSSPSSSRNFLIFYLDLLKDCWVPLFIFFLCSLVTSRMQSSYIIKCLRTKLGSVDNLSVANTFAAMHFSISYLMVSKSSLSALKSLL